MIFCNYKATKIPKFSIHKTTTHNLVQTVKTEHIQSFMNPSFYKKNRDPIQENILQKKKKLTGENLSLNVEAMVDLIK